MPEPLILASASETRARLLRATGLEIEIVPARIDEAALRGGFQAEGAAPRDVADRLAELKARKVAARHPGRLVLGCDQVLDHGGRILGKPATPEEARAQLRALSGGRHRLLSAAVASRDAEVLWRHVGVVRLEMREISDSYLDGYLARNWESLRHSVGGYRLEEEGARFFTAIEGDYFTVLGLPLLPLLSWLALRGSLPV